MNLNFNQSNIENYHSASQKARIFTELWVAENMFCPRCGNIEINHFPNNKPVADFYCSKCLCEYELKSKNGSISKKVSDGAYSTMIERINSDNNPDFLFMGYSKSEMKVKDLVLVPKHFFVPEIIEKRKPLSSNARRAGWTGCNIILDKVPKQGIIKIISNETVENIDDVVRKVNRAYTLEIKDINARGWLFDILNCVNLIPAQTFSLDDMYGFEGALSEKHPQNNNVKPKIRQQLQILRDKGFIEFVGRGQYKKIV